MSSSAVPEEDVAVGIAAGFVSQSGDRVKPGTLAWVPSDAGLIFLEQL